MQTLSPVPQAAFSLHCEEQTRQQQASRPTGHWPIHENGEWILDLCKIEKASKGGLNEIATAKDQQKGEKIKRHTFVREKKM